MGVFDFIKEAGAKVFGSDEKEEEVAAAEPQVNHAREAFLRAQAEEREEAARTEALTMMLDQYGYDMSQINLIFDDGIVTLTGAVDTQDDLESIVLLLGNTAEVGQVDAQLEVLNPTPEATFYTVVKGDNLSKIAKEFYGKSSRYREIFEANKPMLTNPDKIYPGQVLRIPQDPELVG